MKFARLILLQACLMAFISGVLALVQHPISWSLTQVLVLWPLLNLTTVLFLLINDGIARVAFHGQPLAQPSPVLPSNVTPYPQRLDELADERRKRAA